MEALLDAARAEAREAERQIASLLDVDSAWDAARARVRELRFLAKVAVDIDAMLAVLENG